jgi:hypothetical protein
MKPKIFIGSTTENLDIAYVIQENLEHDAQMTVWTQGIFKLSANILDSLITSLENFDFAIFVFYPDDITQIRNATFETVRDNLIFELGLFVGKLGKEKVFFLVPRTVEKLHLPTDLLGVIPGTYDNLREDKNLHASLGPFCNQVRKEIKEFIYENIEDIQNEPDFIKKIVIEKPRCWEYLFAAELLKFRLISINNSFEEIEKGFVFQKLLTYSDMEFFIWFQNSIVNLKNFIELFERCLIDFSNSFGPPGIAGKPIEIRNAVDRMFRLCREIMNWEYELNSINPSEELIEVKNKLKGTTKALIIDAINKIHKDIKLQVDDLNNGRIKPEELKLNLNLKVPESIFSVIDIFKANFEKT